MFSNSICLKRSLLKWFGLYGIITTLHQYNMDAPCQRPIKFLNASSHLSKRFCPSVHLYKCLPIRPTVRLSILPSECPTRMFENHPDDTLSCLVGLVLYPMKSGTISLALPKRKSMEEGLVNPHWLSNTRTTPSFPQNRIWKTSSHLPQMQTAYWSFW